MIDEAHAFCACGNGLAGLSEGKDIWNEGIDLMLEVMLFASIIFMSISVVLFIIMINSNSNSFCMKLKERERYIDMLIYLGMTKKDCICFFMTFFVLRVMVALLFATCINGILIMTINNYIHNVLKIDTAFSNIKPTLVTAIFVLSIVIMNISFLRVWRNKE